MAHKMIGVSEKLHAKVKKISKSNYRGIGEQIEYWVGTSCTHPQRERLPLSVTYTMDGEAINANDPRFVTSRGFYCRACRKTIVPEPVL